jgi:hypothetical protein
MRIDVTIYEGEQSCVRFALLSFFKHEQRTGSEAYKNTTNYQFHINAPSTIPHKQDLERRCAALDFSFAKVAGGRGLAARSGPPRNQSPY